MTCHVITATSDKIVVKHTLAHYIVTSLVGPASPEFPFRTPAPIIPSQSQTSLGGEIFVIAHCMYQFGVEIRAQKECVRFGGRFSAITIVLLLD